MPGNAKSYLTTTAKSNVISYYPQSRAHQPVVLCGEPDSCQSHLNAKIRVLQGVLKSYIGQK